MGVIRSVIKEEDRAKEEMAEASAHLDALSELAQSKADLFEEKIRTRIVNAGQGSDRTVPISQILAFKKETHAYLSQGEDYITKAVGDSIKGFVDGGSDNVVKGITKLLSTVVGAIFGSSSGGEDTRDEYYIVNEGIALVRLDFMGWKRHVTGKSLTKSVTQVSAFTLSKSVVDMSKLDFGTFMAKYQTILKADNPGLTTGELLKICRETYDAFTASYPKALAQLKDEPVKIY